jgi:DNA-binding transcriptional LysR family regulator
MELRHVRYFLAVAEELNFTRAALKVGIGQPPLSQQIRSLEHEIGAPLFRRLSHGAELTEAGQAFLPEARALLAQAARALHSARRGALGQVGRISVGFTGSAAFCPVVPAALRAFGQRYPAVELCLEEANTATLLERLLDRQLDAAFIRPGRLDPDGVRVRTLGHEAMVAAVPADHRLAKGKTLALSMLAREPLILFPRAAGPSLFDEIMVACRLAGFEPVLGQEAPQITSVANLVAAGLGVSVVPASIAQILVAGVVYVPIRKPTPIARLALVTPLDGHSPIVRQFVAVVDSVGRPNGDVTR